jgi:hypothetical protein
MASESEADVKQSTRQSLEETMLRLCAEQGAGRSVDPTAVAKAFAEARGEDELGWRKWLVHTRSAAVGMARQGRLVIYRKGKPADPEDFRGVWRMGLPRDE